MSSHNASTTMRGRLVVVGANGLIGGAVAEEARRQGVEVVGIGRGQTIEGLLGSDDVVLNCALDPAYRTGVYSPDVDLERQTAEIARRAGARVVMLSTRKVYEPRVQWAARETDPTVDVGVGYGANKARTEAWLRDALGERALIVRLSNVFGFEFAGGQSARPSFFGQMLYRLKTLGEIQFDMSPATRRDFIPVEVVATELVGAIRRNASGVYNLSGGSAIACGDIADALITGYGRGCLRAVDDVRDEFFLNCTKWTLEIGPIAPFDPLVVATAYGERLGYA